MAPTYPWGGSKPKQTTKLTNTSFPSLKDPEANKTAPESEYNQVQEDELLVLGAIYGDDFEREDTKPGAWKKLEPSFNIRITSATEDLSVVLHVVFTATYPKSTPLLTLKLPDRLREGTKFKLQKVVETKPDEMAAERPMEPMIHEIGEALKEVLDGAAEAEAAGREIPSLEEERANHEAAVALKVAKEEEEKAAREKEAQIAEEERLTADAQVLAARYEQNTKDSRRKSKAPVAYEDQIVDEDLEAMRAVVAFDEPIKIVDDFDNERTFQAVTSYYRIRQGPVSECFTARPVLKGDPIQLLVLKKTTIRSSENKKSEFRAQLAGLEREISTLMKIDRDNILRIYAYKLTKESGTNAASDGLWTVSILTEYGNKGSLEECLDISGSLMAERVKSWAMALLDALTYLHSQGITHRNLHASNVLLVRSPLGVVTPKIADVGFQHRLHTLKNATSGKLELARSVYWVQPENVNSERPQYTDKTDIWDFGIIFLQMIWGLGVLREFSSPQRIPEEQVVSRPLEDMIRRLFSSDPRKRPRASDLKMSTFLTTTEGTDDEVSMPLPKSGSSVALTSLSARRGSKVDHRPLHFSRYHEDFIQEGRLGKGGFGEVLKARKKLDGQFYAVKKITQKSSSSLEEIIKEVQFLSALRHPYIVQYHNSWTEIIPDTGDADDTELDSSTAEGTTGPSPQDNGLRIEFGTSTGGLDFISSSRFIEFDDDDDDADTASDDDDEEAIIDDEDESSSLSVPVIQHRNRRQLALTRTRSDSRPGGITVLYIQMEYCEGKTLRDVIKRGSLLDNVDEIWRLFRQLLEALKYLHGNNVVHRDLKPENVFIDGASNIRLGDFGLATSGQYTIPETLSSTQGTHDMTTNIGTASYVAPEVMLGADYTSKVDLYSLGIILFEMCYHPIVGMERAEVLKELRNPKTKLPADFQADKKGHFGDIILSLLNHDPEVRPSSSSLLDSGKLPVQMGSEAIQLALASLQDPKSPYYPKMMAALYSRPTDQAKDLAWDMSNKKPPAPADSIMRTHVKEQLISVFRLHGALEVPRPIMFPRSSYYASDAVQLLEPGGTLVQLRYDLTLPFARSIAKNPPRMQNSYAFGDVFRDKSGGQPLSFGEVNFDIVSDSLDLALKEAEVIKVLDEIIASFPCMANVPMCFQLNHSDILNLIFDHCGVDVGCRLSATETLSKLHVSQWTWARIKTDLRSNGLSAASIDELSSFDFRDSPDRVFQKLKTLLDGTEAFNRASPAIAHLKDVVKYINRFGVTSKIFITPLGSIRERFYKGGMLFSCLYDRDKKEVFAAGGRYDSLVREFLPKTGRLPEVCHAVGFNFAWENLAQSMFSYHQKSIRKQSRKPAIELRGIWTGKRCDVLVGSFDGQVLRSEGVSLMNELWRNQISAELAGDARSPEDLMSKYKDYDHFWIVTIKQDSMVKIKTMGRKDVEDVDMAESQVISWLRGQIRDRDHREGQNLNKMTRRTSHNDGPVGPHLKQQVHILSTGTKAKKAALKNSIQTQAQVAAAKLVEGFLEGQVLAIETTDDVLFKIKETPLSDPDKWKQLAQSVGPGEKRYIQQIEDHLKGLLANRRGERRNAFLYNSRTDLSSSLVASLAAMAAQPSDGDIEQMVMMSGISRDEAIRRLKGNNNDLNLAINELFDNPDSKKYHWEEGAFNGDRDGAANNNTGISFQVQGADDPGGGSFYGAPTRPPSRSSNTSPLGGIISLEKEHAAANPGATLARDEIGDIDLQRALAQSAEEAGIPPQQYGVTQGPVQFGPANKPTYDESQWGMVRGNSSVQDFFPDPDAVNRRRESSTPAFLKPSTDSNRLAAILTIYHEIPLIREILLDRTNLMPNYGNDPEWWAGKAIELPDSSVPESNDVNWGLPTPRDYIEFVREVQRLMAFLDKTDRSYGSAEPLVDNAALRQSEAIDVEQKFFEALNQIYCKPDERVPISSLFSEAVQPSLGEGPLQSRHFAMLDLEIPHISIAGDVETLYDLADYALWMMSGPEANTRAFLKELGEVIAFRITGGDGKGIKVPATWYPDRYMESNVEASLEMSNKKAAIRDRMNKICALENKLTYYTFPTLKTVKVKDLLHASMRHDTDLLPANDLNGDGSDSLEAELSSEPKPTQRLDISAELKNVLDGIDKKLKALADEKEKARESLRELSKLYTKPATEAGQPPIHKYTLCGVSISNHITYVRRRAEPDLIEMDLDADGTAKDADQWWKIEYSPTGSQQVNVVKVAQTEVLFAASKESNCCIIVYASEAALADPRRPLPEPLENFVRADNLAFRAEFSTNPDLVDASTDNTSPRSPPKRKFNSSSEDSSAEDGSRVLLGGLNPAPPFKIDGVDAATHHGLTDTQGQYQAPWSSTDDHSEVNQRRQDVIMEKDGQESGIETPQPSGVKSVEMEAKSGMPLLVPTLSKNSEGGVNTSDGMDVDDLPAQVSDKA
ncbi:hypothetical protein V492_04854 [Pseudogymnoascus sp. VKM F-4246]|nr:hypothetical protein V492_04854 [Pseudogymnoascus sp. VKM F-4246]